VPLLVLVGFVVGLVARRRGVETIVGPLLDVVPGAANTIVRDELIRLAGARISSVAPVGAGVFLWTASSGLHTLADVFEVIALARRRTYWQKRLIAVVALLVGLAATSALAWTIVHVDAVVHVRDVPRDPSLPGRHAIQTGWITAPGSGSRGGNVTQSPQRPSGAGAPGSPFAVRMESAAVSTIAAAMMIAVATALLAGFYRVASARRRGSTRVWPGAVFAMGSWLAVSWAFGVYAKSIGDYALYYGSLAAVAVLLVWLYLTSLSLLVGAELNAVLTKMRH